MTGSDGGASAANRPGFALRDAAEADVGEVLRLVRALAEYERLLHEVEATEAELRAGLFGGRRPDGTPVPPRAHAVLAEAEGRAVGLGLWFYNYSTFTGRPGLYVEDVFVEPAHRGRGIGLAIFRHLARRALAEGCARMEWSVLDWNEPAIRFYRALGARAKDEWTVQRLSGESLAALATGG